MISDPSIRVQLVAVLRAWSRFVTLFGALCLKTQEPVLHELVGYNVFMRKLTGNSSGVRNRAEMRMFPHFSDP